MKSINWFFISGIVFYLIFVPANAVFGCTDFMLKTNEGIVKERTMDYDHPLVYNTQTYTNGQLVTSVYTPPPPKIPYSWTVANDFITVNNVLPNPPNYLVAFEGMNKAGISISGNLAGADYPNSNPTLPTLSSDDIVRYILSLASNLNYVKTLFSSINIVSSWQYHYIVFDSYGNSLVVEFSNCQAVFHDNTTPILSNNLNLDYQLENLNNYANLKNYNSNSIIQGSGNQFHGAGMFGLPGKWMSP